MDCRLKKSPDSLDLNKESATLFFMFKKTDYHILGNLVGMTGLEPAASRSRTVRSTT